MYLKLNRWLIAVSLLPAVAVGETTSFTCSFPIEATPKGLSKMVSPFELRFVVDASTRKAYLLGNVGSGEVDVVLNTDGISFVETTASGNVMVTAIANSGEAVHSRNGIIFKKMLPSQFYGRCTVK